MEKFWNIIHFFAYKLMNKWFMPSKILMKWFNSSLSRKLLAINGRTPEMAMKDFKFAMTDKRFGQSSFWAFGIMFAMPFVFCFALQCFYIAFVAKPKNPGSFFFVMLLYGSVSAIVNYFLLLHKDKYIKYFKKFEKQPREWKVKWAWISVGVILFPFLVLIGSFIAMLPK